VAREAGLRHSAGRMAIKAFYRWESKKVQKASMASPLLYLLAHPLSEPAMPFQNCGGQMTI